MKLFDAAERRGVVTLLPLLAVVVLLVTIVEIIEKPKIITHDEPTLELRDFDPNSYEYEQLREAGVAPDLVRLSVGIENAEDIIADLEQAMAKM